MRLMWTKSFARYYVLLTMTLTAVAVAQSTGIHNDVVIKNAIVMDRNSWQYQKWLHLHQGRQDCGGRRKC